MMAPLNVALVLFSAVSFFIYGVGCFVSNFMRREFARYRIPAQRRLVGGLQIAAAAGLLVGLSLPWVGRAAAAGLAVMMLVAVGVRLEIRDSPLQAAPAFFYSMLNAYLGLRAF